MAATDRHLQRRFARIRLEQHSLELGHGPEERCNLLGPLGELFGFDYSANGSERGVRPVVEQQSHL